MPIGTIGKYERLDVLGHGASGVVYLAWDTFLRRNVALKEIRCDGPEMERVLEEARVLERLGNHPHIVQVHTVDREGGVVLIDMELVRGRNLSEIIRERGGEPFPIAEACRIVLDVLDALGYAHERRIIHRDIKPANILIGNNGLVKLTDFGLAEALGTGSVAGGGGTYPYMAPEDFSEDASSDYRSDIWAVGVVLYELLTGQRPFAVARTRDPFAWKRAIMEEEPPKAASRNPQVSSALDNVLSRALAKDKAARFATARLFADTLRAALPNPSPEPSSDAVRIYATPPQLSFAGGTVSVRTLDELLPAVTKHWDEGRALLGDGRMERFLRDIGEVYIADLAAELSERSGESLDRRLQEFIERSQPEEPSEPVGLPLTERTAGRRRPRRVRIPVRGNGDGSNNNNRGVNETPSVVQYVSPTIVASPFEPDAEDATVAAPRLSAPDVPAPVSESPPQKLSRRERKEQMLADRAAEREAAESARAARTANAQNPSPKNRWWFLPLLFLCMGPTYAVFQLRPGLRSDGVIFAGFALSGFLSAMLMLVGVGAHVPGFVRAVCFFPLAVGLIAFGIEVSRIVGPQITPDTLMPVSLLLLVPLFVLLVQASTVGKMWRTWGWIVFLLAGLCTFGLLSGNR
jgi:serine/threonine protein kinase